MNPIVLTLLVAALAAPAPAPAASTATLTEVATSPHQWTGVAVSKSGRIFVNFPRWHDSIPMSVGELQKDGSVTPFPDGTWNTWKPGDPPAERLVCVQSVVVDHQDRLWLLDPGNPQFRGVVPGAPKLVAVELKTNQVVRTITFGPDVVRKDSYLNDVRFDRAGAFAYLTDSGVGGIVVVDLKTGQARRRLTDHASTQAEPILVRVEGKPLWEQPDGTSRKVHSDGIALPPDERMLYFQALTAKTLYRVPTEALRDPGVSEATLGALVEPFAELGPVDGLLFDGKGRLYLSTLEDDAIHRLAPDGTLDEVVRDPRIIWPDSFAEGPDGAIWFTTSLINRGPQPGAPYGLYRITP